MITATLLFIIGQWISAPWWFYLIVSINFAYKFLKFIDWCLKFQETQKKKEQDKYNGEK